MHFVSCSSVNRGSALGKFGGQVSICAFALSEFQVHWQIWGGVH